VSVKQVAEAIVGAIERGKGGEIYQIGDENLTWEALLTRLGRAAGVKKRVITLPNWIVRIGMGLAEFYIKLRGREGGLDLMHFAELQTSKTFFDPRPSREALGFNSGGLDKALEETIAAC